MSIRVTNIQRMSLSDGPGIRSTVFLKGCSIYCPWCSNPENICHEMQIFFDEKKCFGLNGVCLFNPKCELCWGEKKIVLPRNKIAAKCLPGAIGIYGIDYEEKELFEELMRDEKYWRKKQWWSDILGR